MSEVIGVITYSFHYAYWAAEFGLNWLLIYMGNELKGRVILYRQTKLIVEPS